MWLFPAKNYQNLNLSDLFKNKGFQPLISNVHNIEWNALIEEPIINQFFPKLDIDEYWTIKQENYYYKSKNNLRNCLPYSRWKGLIFCNISKEKKAYENQKKSSICYSTDDCVILYKGKIINWTTDSFGKNKWFLENNELFNYKMAFNNFVFSNKDLKSPQEYSEPLYFPMYSLNYDRNYSNLFSDFFWEVIFQNKNNIKDINNILKTINKNSSKLDIQKALFKLKESSFNETYNNMLHWDTIAIPLEVFKHLIPYIQKYELKNNYILKPEEDQTKKSYIMHWLSFNQELKTKIIDYMRDYHNFNIDTTEDLYFKYSESFWQIINKNTLKLSLELSNFFEWTYYKHEHDYLYNSTKKKVIVAFHFLFDTQKKQVISSYEELKVNIETFYRYNAIHWTNSSNFKKYIKTLSSVEHYNNYYNIYSLDMMNKDDTISFFHWKNNIKQQNKNTFSLEGKEKVNKKMIWNEAAFLRWFSTPETLLYHSYLWTLHISQSVLKNNYLNNIVFQHSYPSYSDGERTWTLSQQRTSRLKAFCIQWKHLYNYNHIVGSLSGNMGEKCKIIFNDNMIKNKNIYTIHNLIYDSPYLTWIFTPFILKSHLSETFVKEKKQYLKTIIFNIKGKNGYMYFATIKKS